MKKANTVSLVLRIIAITVIIIIVALIAAPRLYNMASYPNHTLVGSMPCRIDQSLLQSLQSAAANYSNQQHTPPKSFSDFVVERGLINPPKTLTLENAHPQIDYIKGLDTNKLFIIFKSGPKELFIVIYHLNGTNVTAEYKGF